MRTLNTFGLLQKPSSQEVTTSLNQASFTLSPYVSNLPTLAQAHSSAIRKILADAEDARDYCAKRLWEK